MNGWIKLYRKTLESNMYQQLNSTQRDVMITCLMLASHKKNQWEWNGEIHTIQPGQFITSLSSLEKKCAKDVSIQNIRTALSKLEKWEFLTSKSTNNGRLITIVKWASYQDRLESQQANQQNTNKVLTKHQQSANNYQEGKKNDQEVIYICENWNYESFEEPNPVLFDGEFITIQYTDLERHKIAYPKFRRANKHKWIELYAGADAECKGKSFSRVYTPNQVLTKHLRKQHELESADEDEFSGEFIP